MRRVHVVLAGGLLLVLTAVGCLEFDEQTVYFEYDRHRDMLLMIVNYGGLYAESSIEQSRTQLEDAIQVKRAAFIGNWPFSWSSEDLRKEMTDPEQEKDTPKAVRAKLLRLTELVTVLNAGFYTDGAGRICGAQVVVIEHASEAVNLMNDAFNGMLLAEPEEEKASEFDKLARQYALRGHRWLDLDGSSLIVRVPATEKMVKDGWEQVIAGIAMPEHESTDHAIARLKQFLSTPIFVGYDDGMLTGRLGLPSYPSLLHTRPAEGKYQPNMADYITKTHGLALDSRIASFLLDPDALPDGEAERAAKLMAPRLTQAERVRVFVHQLRAAPSEPLWAMLRKEPLADGQPVPAFRIVDSALLTRWEDWLKAQAPAAQK